MGIFWVGIQTSCSDLPCLSAVQLLLQLRQMLGIMVVALAMEDIVAMEDMDMDMAVASMVVDTLVREMLMLNPRPKQDIIEDMAIMDMEDMGMAVASMVVVTTLVR